MASGYIWPHFLVTLVEMILGFLIGVVLGIAMALLLFFSPRLDRWFNPILSLLNATPRAILYPLFVVWFGFGILPKVAFAVSLVFFVVFFNTYQGLKEVDPDLVNRVRLFGGTRWDLMRHIYLPSVFLWVAGSLRVSVSLAILGAVVGEYLSANVGVGLVIAHSLGLFRAREVLAGLFLLLTVIALLDALLRRLEAHFSRWRLEGGS
jgi:NitT/TauT family transport system permease protein